MDVLKTDVEDNSKRGIPKLFQKIIILKEVFGKSRMICVYIENLWSLLK